MTTQQTENIKTDYWQAVMKAGRKHNKGITHKIDRNGVQAIVGTLDFFGASQTYLQQTMFDLTRAKYKIYDWLAMGLNGRCDDNNTQNKQALRVIVHSFLKAEGNEHKFIEDLQQTDYDIDHSWETVEL